MLTKPCNLLRSIRQLRLDCKKSDLLVIHYRGPLSRIAVLLLPFFPGAKKTIIYDKNRGKGIRRPWKDRFARTVLETNFYRRRCTVLNYGGLNSEKGVFSSFFQPVYSKFEGRNFKSRIWNEVIRFIHVDGLYPHCQPLLACRTIRRLAEEGYPVELHFHGKGVEKRAILKYIEASKLKDKIFLHPPLSPAGEAKIYSHAHFLLFPCRDVAWPDSVLRAMWWGCLPVASPVGCTPDLLGDNQERGLVVYPHAEIIAANLKAVLNNGELYLKKCREAVSFSRQFSEEAYRERIELLLSE